MAKRIPKSNTSKFIPDLPKPLTLKQADLIDAINKKEMVIATGPAGVGKTYLLSAMGAYLYKTGKVEKIVLSRPTIPTGKSIGFFPGSLEEKMEPWVKPFIYSIEEYLGKGATETMIKNGNIEIVPFEVIRGRSFNDSFVILDEAQNCTLLEMKAFVTRHGARSVTVINGDLSQSDLNGSGNGLDVIQKMITNSKDLTENTGTVEFTSNDIVRSSLCKMWVREFEKN